MMPGSRRVVGYLMVIVAVAGIAFNIMGITKIWQWKIPLTMMVKENLVLAGDMVSTSNDLLSLIEDTLETASVELDLMNESLKTISTLLSDVQPLVNSLESLMGDNLPSTLDSTQKSLETAQESADIIDNILRIVSSIPFFPGDPYNPEIPLSKSLEQISGNLANLTPTLETIDSDLNKTRSSLKSMEADISKIIQSTIEVKSSLMEAKKIIKQYQQHIKTIDQKITRAEEKVEGLILKAVWALSIILIWLSFAQAGLLLQGIQIVNNDSQTDHTETNLNQ